MDRKEIDAGYERFGLLSYSASMLHSSCVSVDESKGCVEVKLTKKGFVGDSVVYTFDTAYGPRSSQRELYEKSFYDIVQSVLLGFNGTIFAYGQTGTGKTFTIQGCSNMMNRTHIGDKDDPDLRGLMPNSFHHIFNYVSGSKSTQFLVRASYLEIYKEEIRDLLRKDSTKRLKVKETPDRGVHVTDLSTVLTRNIKEIEKLMSIGHSNRSVGATIMNEQSSRSHAIFIVTVESCEVDPDGRSHIRMGKLNLVDLAGSERQGKTHSEGERLIEATKINLSLHTLGNVISALVDEKCTHVPYRDSKLTRLLQGGNSKTIMVANIGPSSYSYDETVNTLRYASRAKNIKNTPKINDDPKDALLREYQREIQHLKQLLSSREMPPMHLKPSNGAGGPDETDGGEEDSATGRDAYLRELQEKLAVEKGGIINEQNMIAEEKTHLLEELKRKDIRIRKEQAQTAELEAKLRSLESKLLGGGTEARVAAVEAQTRMQEEALVQHRRRLAAHQHHEHRMRARVRAESDNVATLQEGFSSLRYEVEVCTSKLKKLFERIQKIKKETKDLQDEHIIERQKQEEIQGQILRNMKLHQLILENFVPLDDQKRLEERAYFDEEVGVWRFNPADSAARPAEGFTTTVLSFPPSALGRRRSVCRYACLAARLNTSMRFRGENILHLNLDPLPRTTLDYEPPKLAPQIVAALEAALQDEEDLELDGSWCHCSEFRTIPIYIHGVSNLQPDVVKLYPIECEK
ncbi:Kinesin-II subunit [Echinococcus granulosus]|uniref:Kinesin-like protein n=1 Tax=Echinococcus granulosus TaxID=6210 RepID=W6UPZ6_ECHGR|nr:Kinesin-II subunit [Echinococcus granulosus]EUB63308.1 Kinesin-II subunit [Echinococcus granulosus]